MSNEKALKQKADVQHSNDEHIDQDFPGYPNQQPSTDDDIKNNDEKNPQSQKDHGGSASAFSGSENLTYNENDDNENDEFDRRTRQGK
jgi:hypothetical protein